MELLSYGAPAGGVMQIAYVVEDIASEMARLTRCFDIGPFFYLPRFPVAAVEYRGQPSTLDIGVALAYRGTLCIELIVQNDTAPSVYREVVAARGYGYHHIAIGSRDFDVELARYQERGVPLIATATTGFGARVSYLDMGLGSMLELIELAPQVEEFFGMVCAAASDWDGQDPVRTLA